MNALNQVWEDFEKSISPFYEQHERTFDLESFHGRFHIIRCLLLSHYLIDKYQKEGVEVDSPQVYYSVAFHDIARQDNGIDIWERESASRCRSFLVYSKSWNKELANRTSELILKKNPFSIEGQILYDVDVLDYNRFFISEDEKELFDESRLICFGNLDPFKDNPKHRSEAINLSRYLVDQSFNIPIKTDTNNLISVMKAIYSDFLNLSL